jgi:hypothetical protein
MKKILLILLITVTSVFLCWYVSLYFSGSHGPYELIESSVDVNKCNLGEDSWILKFPVLLNGKNQNGVFISNGLPADPETKFWHLDTESGSCVQVLNSPARNELQPIRSSEERILQIVEPPLFSKRHIVHRVEYWGNFSAQWSFRGLHLKRPVYYIGLTGGRTGWGIASSFIGDLYIEGYYGGQKLFVIRRNVYGVKYLPAVATDSLTWDPVNRTITFIDKVDQTGLLFWAHLQN